MDYLLLLLFTQPQKTFDPQLRKCLAMYGLSEHSLATERGRHCAHTAQEVDT